MSRKSVIRDYKMAGAIPAAKPHSHLFRQPESSLCLTWLEMDPEGPGEVDIHQ